MLALLAADQPADPAGPLDDDVNRDGLAGPQLALGDQAAVVDGDRDRFPTRAGGVDLLHRAAERLRVDPRQRGRVRAEGCARHGKGSDGESGEQDRDDSAAHKHGSQPPRRRGPGRGAGVWFCFSRQAAENRAVVGSPSTITAIDDKV